MISAKERRARRQRALQQDLPHLIRLVRRVAMQAKRRGGTISSDNVEHAVTSGAMLLTYGTREYRSAAYGQAMQSAARQGFIKHAGYVRNRYRSLICRWRAA